LSCKTAHSWVEKRGKRFADEEVETELRKWLRQQSKDFCAAGFDALVKRCDKCIVLVEDMSRNKCFCQVQISHVLRFISICDLLTDFSSYIVGGSIEKTELLFCPRYRVVVKITMGS
jgi:hypothetical protein